MKLDKYNQNLALKLNWKQILTAILLFVSFSSMMFFALEIGMRFIEYISYSMLQNLVVYQRVVWPYFDVFLAIISSIFALSFVFRYLFSQPKRFYDKVYRKRLNIVVDQIFYGYNFVFFYLKLFFFYGIMMLNYHVNFLPFKSEYIYVFVLMALVMYLQLWQSIFRYFKRRSYKWFFGIALIILLFSTLLSQFSLISKDRVDALIKNANPALKYDLQLPHSDYSTKIFKRGLINEVLILKNHDQISIVYRRNNNLTISKLVEKLNESMSYYREEEKPFVITQLFVDKRIKMKYIDSILQKLRNAGFNRIGFSVSKNNHILKYHNREFLIDTLVNNYIRIDKEGKFTRSNGDIIVKDSLRTLMRNYDIQMGSSLPLAIKCDSNAVFKDFIFAISTKKQALNDYFEIFAQKVYHKPYNKLSYDEKREVRKYW